jgi:hypothetical protein
MLKLLMNFKHKQTSSNAKQAAFETVQEKKIQKKKYISMDKMLIVEQKICNYLQRDNKKNENPFLKTEENSPVKEFKLNLNTNNNDIPQKEKKSFLQHKIKDKSLTT